MAGVMKMVCMVMACMVVAAPMVAEAQVTCNTVIPKIAPCLGYLTRGAPLTPGCCSAVRSLNNAANTTPARQATCRCLQTAAKALPNLNQNAAAGLPSACHVNVPFPIRTSTNCNNVK